VIFTRSFSEKNVASSMVDATGSNEATERGVLNGAILQAARPMQSAAIRHQVPVELSGRRGATVMDCVPLMVNRKREREASSSDSEVTARGARYQRHQDRHALQFERPTLVFDLRSSTPLNSRMRGTSDVSVLPPAVNKMGLSDLKLSGSAAITALMLKNLRELLGDHPVLVVDLRREPHAVLNEHSVTWTIPNNWLNSDKPLEHAVMDEQRRVDQMRNASPDLVVAVHHKDYKKELSRPFQRVFKQPQVCSERELVERHGMKYLRVGVADHLRPSDEEVQRFLDQIQALPPNTWVHAHCKGGQGRTTTFMVLYDIWRNAHRVSLSDIVERQRHLGFGYDVSSEGLKEERRQFRKDRWVFISDFYAYAKANANGASRTWMDWVTQKPIASPVASLDS
jgi:protein tyrosine phosphatase (PTP) superfamily phosphohydrolase (DUF442 family)